MADAAISNIQQGRVGGSGNNRLDVWGVAAFNSTDAASELSIPGLRVIEAWGFQFAGGPPDADESIYLDETLVSGKVNVPADGKVTVARTGASPTDGTKFSFWFRGY